MARRKHKRGWRRRTAEVRLPGKVASLGPDAYAEVEAEARRLVLENDTPRVRYPLANLSQETGRKLSEIGLARPVRNGNRRYFVAEGDLRRTIESEIQRRARWRRNKRKKFPRGMEPNPQSSQEDKGAVFGNQVSARNGSQVFAGQQDKGAVFENGSFRAEWLATPDGSSNYGCSSNDVAKVRNGKLQVELPDLSGLAAAIARKLQAATESHVPPSSSPPITPLTTTPPEKQLKSPNGSSSNQQDPLEKKTGVELEEKTPHVRRGESEGGTSNERAVQISAKDSGETSAPAEPVLPGFEAAEIPETHETSSPASRVPSHQLIVGLWAKYCPHLPQPTSWNTRRQKAWAARCREPGYLENLERLVAGIGRSKFCAGANDRDWRATVDFAMRAKWPELVERYALPATNSDVSPQLQPRRRNRLRTHDAPQERPQA